MVFKQYIIIIEKLVSINSLNNLRAHVKYDDKVYYVEY